MRHWGIRKKVLVVTLVPTLLTTLLLGLFFTYSWVNNIENLLKDRGESLSRQLAAGSEYGLFTANRSLLTNLSNALLEEQDVRSITFLDRDGERLLHTGPGRSKPLTDTPLKTDRALRLTKDNSTVFITPVNLQDLMIDSLVDPDARQAASTQQEPLGWAAVEMSHVRTDKETYKALLISLLLIIGGVLLSMAISVRLSQAFIQPIFQLNEAVARLKEGKLDTRIYTGAGPEFEQLESGLNEMASELSQAQAEMQQNIDQATSDLRQTLETIEIQNIELDLARKEALDASRIKSEFLANMSHEIRTPLNGIIGFTELVLKSPMPRQQRDHLNTIRKSSEILLTIINDILDFSKIEAGKLILDRIPFQLRDIIEEVMVMLAPEAHSKNLDLVALVYQDVPDNIMGDPLRVKQVITNLINNAIKFTQTGEVILRASLEDENTENNRVTLRLSVTDSGVGLSRAQQHSLFNAFSQADPSTARQYGGTGLGLAISKRLVEEMGGSIGLESELGKGSTFWFTLNPELSTLTNSLPPQDALKGERVIYLEHQQTTGLANEHLLRDWGVTVDRVDTPSAMLEKVAEAQSNNKGYALAMIGITRHLLRSNQYRSLLHTLEVDYDCRTLLLTPTLDTQDTPFSGIPSSHLTKPVRRETFYHELLLLIHGIYANESPVDNQTSTLPGSKHQNSLRILAVDDNEANLKLVLTLLEESQLQAWGAVNGFDAVNLARDKPFDLVLMDLQMPGMDGVEATARIRELETDGHHTCIIALTAHAMASEQAELRKQGFDGYMPKPISSRQLRELVREHTGHEVPAQPAQTPVSEVRDTRSAPRPSSRQRQQGCVSIEESIRLAAGKPDLAEELFSMLLEQLPSDQQQVQQLWQNNELGNLLECVHKLHGATRYCGVPDLRAATHEFETALKSESQELAEPKGQLMAAIERLLAWSEHTDWQTLFREKQRQSETSGG